MRYQWNCGVLLQNEGISITALTWKGSLMLNDRHASRCPYCETLPGMSMATCPKSESCHWITLQETNISHLGKRMLVPWSVILKRWNLWWTFLGWNVRSLRILRWSVVFFNHPAVGDGFKPLEKKEWDSQVAQVAEKTTNIWDGLRKHQHPSPDSKTHLFFAPAILGRFVDTCWHWHLQIYLLHSHWAISGWRKAYESINWPVLNQLLPHLDGHFIKWIIQKYK